MGTASLTKNREFGIQFADPILIGNLNAVLLQDFVGGQLGPVSAPAVGPVTAPTATPRARPAFEIG